MRRRTALARAPRRRRAEKRPAAAIAAGLLVCGLLGIVMAGAISSPRGLPVLDYQRLSTVVPDAGILRAHNEVRMGGVRVGEIKRVSPTDAGTRIRFNLDPGTEPVPIDTRAVVRGRGLLGTRFLELRPGRSPRLARDGDVLPPGRVSLTFGVPETLDTLDAETRGGLGQALRGLGDGLAGRSDDLNDAIRVTPAGIQRFRSIAATVLRRPGAARRLVPSLELGASAMAAAREDLAGMLEPIERVLEPLNEGRGDLQRTLDEAPPAMRALQPALSRGRVLLASARRLATAASTTLAEAPAGLRYTTALLRESRAPLGRAEQLVDATRPAVPAALRITGGLSPLLDPVERALGDLLDPVRILGRHGCDMRNMVSNWRSVLGYGVNGGGPIGPLNNFRIEAIAGPESAGQGSFGRLPNAIGIDRDLYSAPCKYAPQEYDPSGLDGVRRPGGDG